MEVIKEYKILLNRYMNAINYIYDNSISKEITPDLMTFDYDFYNSTYELRSNIDNLRSAVQKAEILSSYYKHNYEFINK